MIAHMRVLLLLACAFAARAGEPLILDETHESQVFRERRHYRIFLPPDYATSGKRYPAIYWFHGWSERYNKPVARDPGRNYDQGDGGVYGGDTIGRFVGNHDVIVVKWDGYNPRTPGETYPRPYNISPVETDRQFPLYFPELVAYIDAHYRTLADREHRATAGLSMGGFMSFWVAGKYPHLVGSSSNFMGSPEFFVGPRGFPVEYILAPDEGHGFARPINNLVLFTSAEKFLAKHLGGRYQESMTPAIAARMAELTVDPQADDRNPEVCDPCDLNCGHAHRNYFHASGAYIGSTDALPPPFSITMMKGLLFPSASRLSIIKPVWPWRPLRFRRFT